MNKYLLEKQSTLVELCQQKDEQIADMQTALMNIRDLLNSRDIDCLGTGSNGQIEWPMRDEVIDTITRILNS